MRGLLDALQDQQFRSDFGNGLLSVAGLRDSEPTTAGLPDADKLAKMGLLQLQALRNTSGLTKEDQNYLGPYEHRAYARENQTIPGSNFLSMLAVPAYTAGKVANVASNAVGIPMKAFGARSAPSIREILQGYQGNIERMTKPFRTADTDTGL